MSIDFEQFWQRYPRKIAKKVALKSWLRLSEDDQKLALEGLERYIKYLQARGIDMEYVLHASTYLNQERWTDELEIPVAKIQQAQWWKSEAGTAEMAKKVGITARPGEDWESIRARIRANLVRAA